MWQYLLHTNYEDVIKLPTSREYCPSFMNVVAVVVCSLVLRYIPSTQQHQTNKQINRHFSTENSSFLIQVKQIRTANTQTTHIQVQIENFVLAMPLKYTPVIQSIPELFNYVRTIQRLNYSGQESRKTICSL